MADSDQTEAAKEGKAVSPCCTRCQGTTYHYRSQTIANIEGLLVYCKTCGGIFSWSPTIRDKSAG